MKSKYTSPIISPILVSGELNILAASNRSDNRMVNEPVALSEEEQLKIEMEANRQADARAKQANSVKENFIKKYGPIGSVVELNGDLTSSVITFPSSRTLFFSGKKVPFDSLISAEIKDDSYSRNVGTSEAITRTNTGSVVGRAIVGSLIAGPAGAIIGGATGKKETTIIDNTREEVYHSYRVIITTDYQPIPKLYIHCPSSYKAQQIKTIVDDIISSNRKAIETATPTQAPLSIADEIEKYAKLLEKGLVTEDEFKAMKNKLLS